MGLNSRWRGGHSYTDIAPPFSFDDPLEVLAYGPPPPPPPPPLPPVLADRPRLQHFGRVLGAACLTPSRCRAGPADPAARLLTANFSAGDVVLFTMCAAPPPPLPELHPVAAELGGHSIGNAG
eukprot:SAG11_NODE_38_length_21705_cov_24.667453_18_plen_123_part_00